MRAAVGSLNDRRRRQSIRASRVFSPTGNVLCVRMLHDTRTRTYTRTSPLRAHGWAVDSVSIERATSDVHASATRARLVRTGGRRPARGDKPVSRRGVPGSPVVARHYHVARVTGPGEDSVASRPDSVLSESLVSRPDSVLSKSAWKALDECSHWPTLAGLGGVTSV